MRMPQFKTVRRGVLLAIVLALVLGADRSHQADANGQMPEISERINAFTIALLQQQAGAGDLPANAVLSPQSVFHGMAMGYVASGGDTRRELAQALGFPSDDGQLLGDLAHLRRQLHAAEQKHLEISMANSAWLDGTYADFRKEYLEEVQGAFERPLRRVNFRQAERVSHEINAWVSERTHGRIAGSVAPGDFRSRSSPGIIDEPGLVCVNTVYFKADWGSRFDSQATHQGDFHVNPATTVAATMMHQHSLLPYAEDDGLKFLEIPYVGRHFSMYVLLPREITPAAELIDGLTMERIVALQRTASRHAVDVLFPKFTMKSHLSVKDALSALGAQSAFDRQEADFDRMIVKKAEAFRVYISEIYQDVWTDVDEEGTKAAAATATVHYSVGCSAPQESPPMPAEFHADHPFLFLVVHNESHSILFAGWVSNPAAVAQEPRPGD